MYKDLFPDHAVKQALVECNLTRSDETVVTFFQTHVLPRCVVDLVRSALLHASLAVPPRKYISEGDLMYADAVCIYPIREAPDDAGELLQRRFVKRVVDETMKVYAASMSKFCDMEVKGVSNATAEKLQELLEARIRAIVHGVCIHAKSCYINTKHVETYLSKLMGDPGLSTCQDNFLPMNC